MPLSEKRPTRRESIDWAIERMAENPLVIIAVFAAAMTTALAIYPQHFMRREMAVIGIILSVHFLGSSFGKLYKKRMSSRTIVELIEAGQKEKIPTTRLELAKRTLWEMLWDTLDFAMLVAFVLVGVDFYNHWHSGDSPKVVGSSLLICFAFLFNLFVFFFYEFYRQKKKDRIKDVLVVALYY